MAEVLVVGPASWTHIVDLDALPEPRPHMTFARGDYSTVGGQGAAPRRPRPGRRARDRARYRQRRSPGRVGAARGGDPAPARTHGAHRAAPQPHGARRWSRLGVPVRA